MRYGSQEWREREKTEAIARAQRSEALRLEVIRRREAAERREIRSNHRNVHLTVADLRLIAASPIPDITAAYLAARNQLKGVS